jgi:uncharacterized RDD family membrane protein YckC
MENYQQPVQQDSLFNDEVMYTTASQGQRFLNWLIDNILIRVVMTQFTATILIRFLLNMAPEFTYEHFAGDPTFISYLVSYGFAIFHYFFYYTICEKAFKGYTLGKLLTGTRAIRNDGGELTMRDAMLRSLSRMVPFEAFSGFGSAPWHDKWTNTTVIKSR